VTTDRTNPVRERIERGDVALGAQVKTYAPAAVELLGDLGLDYVWLDLEHAGPSPYDGPRLEAFSRAAEAAGTSLLVRLPGGEPHMVRKALDAGVRTLLIPRVETAAEVRRAVAAGRFSYDGAPGDRGVGTARGSRWGRDVADHARREDDSVLIGAMIENETAVDDLDAILDVPELGFVFVGPADLSVSLGRPLETDAPAVRERVDSIVAAATDAGVPAGRIANDPAAIESAIADGCRLLRVGSELDAAEDHFRGLLDAVDAVDADDAIDADRGD